MKLYLGESEKAREITFEMGLKGQTEFRQPKIKQKRIPDKGITVSQTTEEGKARISYRGLEGRERKSWKFKLGPVFKEFEEELIGYIRKQWLCFGNFSPLLYEMVVQERDTEDLENTLTGERVRLVLPEAPEFKLCGKRKEAKT